MAKGFVALASLTAMFSAVPLAAQTAAYSGSPFATTQNGQQVEAGYRFTVNSPINLVEFGVYDDGSNGLSTSHTVSLWSYNANNSGTLLRTTTISAGTGATLSDGFRYVSVPSQLLTVGQSYVIAASNYNGSEPIDYFQPTTAPQITFNEGRSGNNSSFPTDGSQFALAGASFRFNAATPEPATWSLMILGFGIVGGTLRRQQRQAVRGASEAVAA